MIRRDRAPAACPDIQDHPNIQGPDIQWGLLLWAVLAHSIDGASDFY
jgi:hypothetical protein